MYNPYYGPGTASVGYVSPLGGLAGYSPIPQTPFAQFGAALQGVGEQAATWIPRIQQQQQQQSQQAWQDLQNQLTLEPNMDAETKRRLFSATEQRLKMDPRYRNFSFSRDATGQIVVPNPAPEYQTGTQFVADPATRAVMEQRYGIKPDEWNKSVQEIEYAHPQFRNQVGIASQIARLSQPGGQPAQPVPATPTPTVPPQTGVQPGPAVSAAPPPAPARTAAVPPAAGQAAAPPPAPPPAAAQAAAPPPAQAAAPSPGSIGAAMAEVNRRSGQQAYSAEQIAANAQTISDTDINPVTQGLDFEMTVSRLTQQAEQAGSLRAQATAQETAKLTQREITQRLQATDQATDTDTIVGYMRAGQPMPAAEHAAMDKKWGARMQGMIAKARTVVDEMLVKGAVKDPVSKQWMTGEAYAARLDQRNQFAKTFWVDMQRLGIQRADLAIAQARDGRDAKLFEAQMKQINNTMTSGEKESFAYNQKTLDTADPTSDAFRAALALNQAIALKYHMPVMVGPQSGKTGQMITQVQAALAGAQQTVAVRKAQLDAMKPDDPLRAQVATELNTAVAKQYSLNGELTTLRKIANYQQGTSPPAGTAGSDLPPPLTPPGIGTGPGQKKIGTVALDPTTGQTIVATSQGWKDRQTGRVVYDFSGRVAPANIAQATVQPGGGAAATPADPNAALTQALSQLGGGTPILGTQGGGAGLGPAIGVARRAWAAATTPQAPTGGIPEQVGRSQLLQTIKPYWIGLSPAQKRQRQLQFNLQPAELRQLEAP